MSFRDRAPWRAGFAGRALRTILVAAAALSAGCGLFEPRDPEEPSAQSPCAPRTTPQVVESTVEGSYGRASGTTCYIDALETGFRFHPDPTDSIEENNPDVFANWTRQVELEVVTKLVADTLVDRVSAAFDREYASPTISDDQRTQVRYYEYHVITWPSGGGDSTRYQGLADITFQQGSDQFWLITNWQDKRDGSGYPTWGRLRRNYRSGV